MTAQRWPMLRSYENILRRQHLWKYRLLGRPSHFSEESFWRQLSLLLQIISSTHSITLYTCYSCQLQAADCLGLQLLNLRTYSALVWRIFRHRSISWTAHHEIAFLHWIFQDLHWFPVISVTYVISYFYQADLSFGVLPSRFVLIVGRWNLTWYS